MKKLGWLLPLLLLLVACEKEDETMFPNALWEFANIRTDASGKAAELTTDENLSYTVANSMTLARKDTLLRVICVYLAPEDKEKGATVQLMDALPIFASQPIAENKFEKVYTNPLYIQGIWKTDRYINLIVQLMAKDKKHLIHYASKGISEENGKKVLSIRLLHNQNGDYEAYRQKVYLSIPIASYQKELRKGEDIIRLLINTYEGEYQQDFIY